MGTIEVDRRAFDELADSVGTLTRAVDDWKRGSVDRQTVERIAAEVAGRRSSARRSFTPEDDGPSGVFGAEARMLQDLQGRERLDAIQALPASVVASTLGRPADDVRRYQEAADGLVLVGAYLRAQASDQYAFDVRETGYYRDVFQPAIQALDTATTAEGVEYIPTMLSASLIERIQLDLLVAPLFVPIEMQSNPFAIPGLSTTRQRTGRSLENTADTGQTPFKKITPATRKVTLTAVKIAAEILVSREMEEDALVAVLPFIQQEIVDYISADIEDAIVNGDTAGTLDTGWATDDPRKAWNGLRKGALAAAKVDGGGLALTAAMLRKNRKVMGVYGVRQDQLAHIVSMSGYVDLIADTATLTLEKYGPFAVVLTGELAKVDGIPVVVSQYVRQDLNAAGVYDNVVTTKTEALTVNRRGFFFGNRREMTVQVLRELYAEDDQDAVVASVRKAFAARFAVATEPTVAITYNLST